MEKIRLEITIDEANTILAALGQQPYLKVADLIQKIQTQGASQVNESSQQTVSTPHQNGTETLAQEQNGK
jgi:hypothetical protein